ncbi:MAG: hypothetical protein N2442_09180 [Spirochaetes bacterium]|nr:hypothetical protein [Spirochaetota bacterium]
MGSLHSIPVIDIAVQGREPKLTSPARSPHPVLDNHAHFTLKSLTTFPEKQHWLHPLRMTFSIDSIGIYYRNRLLRSCFKPFSETSMETLPSYGLLRIQEFTPVFSLSQEPFQIPTLVSSLSITFALPK